MNKCSLHISLPFVFFFILLPPLSAKGQSVALPSKINIYCTNNLDGTGECYEVKTNTLLKCTGVPGDSIPCRIPGGASYNCIFFAPGLLSCSEFTSKVNQQLPIKIETKNIFNDVLDDEINTPVTGPSERQGIDSNSGTNEETQPSLKTNQLNNSEKPIIIPVW